MKLSISRRRITMSLIGGMLFAICFSAATAHAQSAFKANLTLPYEVHWGAATLSPGNYVLTFNGDNVRPMVVVRDAKTFRTVALEPVGIEERGNGGTSALLIGKRGQWSVVDSFRIAELNQVFVFSTEPANRRVVEEANARKSPTLPVAVAMK